MQTEIIFAGFGGQGVLFAGQVLAFAAMDTGSDVRIPSFSDSQIFGFMNRF